MEQKLEAADERGRPQPHVIHYWVGDERQTTTKDTLTPFEIMSNAGINPNENYLVEIRGRQRVSYQDKPDDPIKMHDGQKFVVVFVGPVPVS
jgi:hypothetical protein